MNVNGQPPANFNRGLTAGNGAFVVAANGALAINIDAAGALTVGASAPFDAINMVEIISQTSTPGLGIYAFNNSSSNPGAISLYHARGTSTAGVDLQSGDLMGMLICNGYSNGAFRANGATYRVAVDGTFTTGHRPPSRVEILTNAENANAVVGQTVFNNQTTTLAGKLTISSGGISCTGGLVTDTAVFNSVYDNGNMTGNVTINWNNGNDQKGSVTGNTTISFTDPAGPTMGRLRLTNTGNFTVTWPANTTIGWGSKTAPTFTTGNGSIDEFFAAYEGSSKYTGSAIQNVG